MSEKKYREARKNVGLKPEEASASLGVSITTLYNWENERTQPDANNIKDMARLYSVSTDYLLGIG